MVEDSCSKRVKKFISSNGLEAEIRVLEPDRTKTALLASQALECSIAEIAKTIGFVKSDGEKVQPILSECSLDREIANSAKQISSSKRANTAKPLDPRHTAVDNAKEVAKKV